MKALAKGINTSFHLTIKSITFPPTFIISPKILDRFSAHLVKVPSSWSLTKVLANGIITLSLRIWNGEFSTISPNSLTPARVESADLVAPDIVDNPPLNVLACFSIAPPKRESIISNKVLLNNSKSLICPLLLKISKPLLLPNSAIIFLVIPNSFNLSSSPVLASAIASIAWSKLFPIPEAMSPIISKYVLLVVFKILSPSIP